jgi:hypothetical protein
VLRGARRYCDFIVRCAQAAAKQLLETRPPAAALAALKGAAAAPPFAGPSLERPGKKGAAASKQKVGLLSVLQGLVGQCWWLAQR